MPGSSWILRASCLVLLGLIILSNTCHAALLLLSMNVTISSSGRLIYPTELGRLHVEGRYIKDGFGNIVVLRGVNKVQFPDYVTCRWLNKLGWNESRVKAELDAMKEWGCNVIRSHMVVKWWVDNPVDPYTDGGKTHRQMIKDLITWAGERGMYFIFEPAYILDYLTAQKANATGGGVENLPYPPWLATSGAEAYINSTDDLVDYWVSVADELRSYPNVIFELWNEPGGGVNDPPENDQGQTPLESWTSVTQTLIDEIRETGATQLILVQWDYGPWYNFDYGNGKGWLSQWIPQLNLTDPLNNIVYSAHLYRHAGAYGVVGDRRWNYSDVKEALTAEGLLWTVETLGKPLFVGEIGCNLAWTGIDLEHEIEAFRNALTILNEWGVGYAGYWWRSSGRLRLIEEWEPKIEPTISGRILGQKIAEGMPFAPGKGRIRVQAFFNSTEVVADGLIVETGQRFRTPVTIEVLPSEYSVHVTFQARSENRTVVVIANQTVNIDVQF